MKPGTLPSPQIAKLLQSSTSAWWALTLTYYVIGCLMHLQFSLWLVRKRETLVGRIAYADLMPGLVVAGAASLLLWLVVRLHKGPRPRLTAAFWLLWLATVTLIDRYLTYSINEYAHYPQYALLAWMVARAMDPQRTRWYVGRVLFWATLLGAGDELLQYMWITTSYSDYFDFNDVLTNLAAAAAGTLLYYGTASRPSQPAQRSTPFVEIGAATALTLVIATGLFTARIVHTPAGKIPPGGIGRQIGDHARFYLQRDPGFYSAWQRGQRQERYYVLAPATGLLIILTVGLTFAGYGRNTEAAPLV